MSSCQRPAAGGGYAFVDVDDTIIEVHGHAKQGAGFGDTRVRGLNALIATVATSGCAPLVVAQRPRKGACGSPRGARRIPDVHATRKQAAGQGTLFDLCRFHAFFTTVPAEQLDTVAADSTHRGHAIIEQVHADLTRAAAALTAAPVSSGRPPPPCAAS